MCAGVLAYLSCPSGTLGRPGSRHLLAGRKTNSHEGHRFTWSGSLTPVNTGLHHSSRAPWKLQNKHKRVQTHRLGPRGPGGPQSLAFPSKPSTAQTNHRISLFNPDVWSQQLSENWINPTGITLTSSWSPHKDHQLCAHVCRRCAVNNLFINCCSLYCFQVQQWKVFGLEYKGGHWLQHPTFQRAAAGRCKNTSHRWRPVSG